jgi:alpha-mannosidase
MWKEGGHYLRVYETTGQGGPVEITLPFEATICESVDFNGRRLDSPKIDLHGDRIQFHINAWEIVTLRLSFPPATSAASVPDYVLRYESW